MLPISTLGYTTRQIDVISDTRRTAEKLSLQLSTGKESIDLADNSNRLAIIDLRAIKQNRETYLTSVDQATTVVGENKVVLDHLKTVVSDALKYVQKARGDTGAFDPALPNFDPEQRFKQLSDFVSAAMQDVTITLNQKSSNSYLFSGSRTGLPYTTPPVVDLTNKALVPDFTTVNPPPAVPSVDNPTPLTPLDPRTGSFSAPPGPAPFYVNPTTQATQILPIYDSDANSANVAAGLQTILKQAWTSPKATIDDGQTVDYRFTSVDATFQHLVNGLRAARTAADHASATSTPAGERLSIADRNAYLDLAISSLDKALNGDPTNAALISPIPKTLGIKGMSTKNDLNQLTLDSKKKFHQSQVDILTAKLDRMEGIDTTEVTATLAATNNQLEASYKATSSLLNLSLLNFLK